MVLSVCYKTGNIVKNNHLKTWENDKRHTINWNCLLMRNGYLFGEEWYRLTLFSGSTWILPLNLGQNNIEPQLHGLEIQFVAGREIQTALPARGNGFYLGGKQNPKAFVFLRWRWERLTTALPAGVNRLGSGMQQYTGFSGWILRSSVGPASRCKMQLWGLGSKRTLEGLRWAFEWVAHSTHSSGGRGWMPSKFWMSKYNSAQITGPKIHCQKEGFQGARGEKKNGKTKTS